MFHGCFLTNIKAAWFVALLIVLAKWEVSARLEIYPKKILGLTNHARKARRQGA